MQGSPLGVNSLSTITRDQARKHIPRQVMATATEKCCMDQVIRGGHMQYQIGGLNHIEGQSQVGKQSMKGPNESRVRTKQRD